MALYLNRLYDADPMTRNISKMQTVNKGDRSLFESIMAPEVIAALKAFSGYLGDGVLVGGLALSYYVKPRYTQDVDVLFLDMSAIPESVPGFNGVLIKMLTPEHISTSRLTVEQVLNTAVVRDGVRVASPSGIVALKLGRLSMQDRADIVALIKHSEIDLTGFDISQESLAKYIALVGDSEDDPT